MVTLIISLYLVVCYTSDQGRSDSSVPPRVHSQGKY